MSPSNTKVTGGDYPSCFAGDKAGHRFESVLDMFRTTLEERPGLKDRQIRQAIDAVIIYRYQFRNRRFPDAPGGRAPDHEQILARARQFARLKRYARSTRKSYLGWIRRFLRWLRQSGVTGSPAEEDVKGFLAHIAMNVETTMIYTHVVRELKGTSGNPLDVLDGSRR